MTRWRQANVDEPAAIALLTEYFASRAETFPAEMGEYRPAFPTPEDFVPPRGLFLIVEGTDLAGDDADIGCGGIRRLDAAAEGSVRFEVKHLWVQPHARGTGLGRRILTELEHRASTLGATELVLDTNASQAAAAALYRSTGYAEIEPYNDNANANVWLRKAL